LIKSKIEDTNVIILNLIETSFGKLEPLVWSIFLCYVKEYWNEENANPKPMNADFIFS
jgi:hypothetical protein